MFDLIIKNGKVVTADRVFEASIAVKDGKIAALIEAGSPVEAKEVIDAKGNYIFPGAIDSHAHLNDPGYLWREDYEHGTAAAGVGGLENVTISKNLSRARSRDSRSMINRIKETSSRV